MKNDVIPVYCWECGKRFEIEIRNVYAGHLFCSEECRRKSIEKEVKYDN